ncbi:hypothetical protein [Mycobacterium sp.]|uniref:thioesterase family protein n=1 Tax=Mycobacterium sp. TaxID=1785 RepID=UPI0033411B4D
MAPVSGFVAPAHVRWSDIDSYQHINHATMVTILEEARIPFLREPFGADITTVGLLIAETQLAAVHIEEQRLQRLSPAQRDYLQHWTR